MTSPEEVSPKSSISSDDPESRSTRQEKQIASETLHPDVTNVLMLLGGQPDAAVPGSLFKDQDAYSPAHH